MNFFVKHNRWKCVTTEDYALYLSYEIRDKIHTIKIYSHQQSGLCFLVRHQCTILLNAIILRFSLPAQSILREYLNTIMK